MERNQFIGAIKEVLAPESNEQLFMRNAEEYIMRNKANGITEEQLFENLEYLLHPETKIQASVSNGDKTYFFDDCESNIINDSIYAPDSNLFIQIKRSKEICFDGEFTFMNTHIESHTSPYVPMKKITTDNLTIVIHTTNGIVIKKLSIGKSAKIDIHTGQLNITLLKEMFSLPECIKTNRAIYIDLKNYGIMNLNIPMNKTVNIKQKECKIECSSDIESSESNVLLYIKGGTNSKMHISQVVVED